MHKGTLDVDAFLGVAPEQEHHRKVARKANSCSYQHYRRVNCPRREHALERLVQNPYRNCRQRNAVCKRGQHLRPVVAVGHEPGMAPCCHRYRKEAYPDGHHVHQDVDRVAYQ
jgi:hypothetical protein